MSNKKQKNRYKPIKVSPAFFLPGEEKKVRRHAFIHGCHAAWAAWPDHPKYFRESSIQLMLNHTMSAVLELYIEGRRGTNNITLFKGIYTDAFRRVHLALTELYIRSPESYEENLDTNEKERRYSKLYELYESALEVQEPLVIQEMV
jgi:hypothetical protein